MNKGTNQKNLFLQYKKKNFAAVFSAVLLLYKTVLDEKLSFSYSHNKAYSFLMFGFIITLLPANALFLVYMPCWFHIETIRTRRRMKYDKESIYVISCSMYLFIMNVLFGFIMVLLIIQYWLPVGGYHLIEDYYGERHTTQRYCCCYMYGTFYKKYAMALAYLHILLPFWQHWLPPGWFVWLLPRGKLQGNGRLREQLHELLLKIAQYFVYPSLGKIATIDQVTTMLATSKNVLFPGHNHLLTTGVDDPSLIITLAGAPATIKVLGHQHWWLAGG